MTRRRTVAALSLLALFASTLVVATITGIGGCKKGDGQAAATTTLNVYIWSEYLPDDVAKRFTEKTGIKLQIDTYDSNETLLAKLQAGGADYDIVVPSDYMVRTLIQEKRLQPIDRSKLSNFANLDARFLDQPFDPGNAHSVPYLWGLTGLGYDKTKVPGGVVDSWAALFDERNAKKVCMLDDTRECFIVALRMMGKGSNETDPKVLAEAAAMLKKQKAAVDPLYDSGDFAAKLAAGDVALAHGYTGQLAKVADEDKDKRFVVVMPKEGGTVAVDNLCIPATSKRAEAAHKFIDFVLEAQNAGEISNNTYYASTNKAAQKYVKPELLNNPAVYAPDDVLKRCEFLRDVGDATQLYDKLWTEIKGNEDGRVSRDA